MGSRETPLSIFINTHMKTFKEILREAKGPIIPNDLNKLRLDHLHPLAPHEEEYRDQRMDRYMDRHGMSGVAAENRVAKEILQMRSRPNI